MNKLIIFDWDDVITLGSKEGYFACYHAALDAVGVRLDPAEERRRILSRWGQRPRDELAALLAETPELVDRALQVYRLERSGETFIRELSVQAGTKALLERLSDRYQLAIATGMDHDYLLTVMEHFALPNVFSAIVTADQLSDPSQQKPSPFMIQSILEQLNYAPSEALMIGDAAGDVRMAQAAGVEPIAVLTGHLDREQAEALGVRHIVKSILNLESELEVMK